MELLSSQNWPVLWVLQGENQAAHLHAEKFLLKLAEQGEVKWGMAGLMSKTPQWILVSNEHLQN